MKKGREVKIRRTMARRGGLTTQQQLELVPVGSSFYSRLDPGSSFYNRRQQVNSSSVRVRRRREPGEGKKKRERHSGDFSNWRGGGGEGGGGGGEDRWGKRVEDGRRLGSSTGCSGEFMFNRATEERQKKKFGIFSEEESGGSWFPPVREEERKLCGGGWRKVCLAEEARMPALSLQSREVKGERLLKRTMTMLEEGRRKVDWRGREARKEMWTRGQEETKAGGDEEVAPKHQNMHRDHFDSYSLFSQWAETQISCYLYSFQEEQDLTGNKTGLRLLSKVFTSRGRPGAGTGAGGARRVRVGLIWLQRSSLFSCWKER